MTTPNSCDFYRDRIIGFEKAIYRFSTKVLNSDFGSSGFSVQYPRVTILDAVTCARFSDVIFQNYNLFCNRFIQKVFVLFTVKVLMMQLQF